MTSSRKFHERSDPARPVAFKWLLFPRQRKARPARDSAGFHKRLARLLQVLLLLSGRNMVPDVWALGVINPGTHKEAFTAGGTAGPLLMPAPVGRLRSFFYQMFSVSMFACQRCQTIQGLLHLLYTVYNAPVCCAAPRRKRCA